MIDSWFLLQNFLDYKNDKTFHKDWIRKIVRFKGLYYFCQFYFFVMKPGGNTIKEIC